MKFSTTVLYCYVVNMYIFLIKRWNTKSYSKLYITQPVLLLRQTRDTKTNLLIHFQFSKKDIGFFQFKLKNNMEQSMATL